MKETIKKSTQKEKEIKMSNSRKKTEGQKGRTSARNFIKIEIFLSSLRNQIDTKGTYSPHSKRKA